MSTRCITPFIVKHNNQNIPAPCGKCPPCVKRRVSGWSFRLVKQGEVSTSALFVTLTYNTDHVPISKNGFMSLEKTDLQKFFKRLRKCYGNTEGNIKYYACGEYGGKTMRPHYHIILFNATVDDVLQAWQLGHSHFGNVTGASIGYTLKYMAKAGKIPIHKNDDRQREFALMSKGLGANYLTEQMVNWHEADMMGRMYCPLEDGKKIAMPRYFKDKIYTKEQREHIGFALAAKADQKERELIDKHGNSYYFTMAEKHMQQFARMHRQAENGTTL